MAKTGENTSVLIILATTVCTKIYWKFQSNKDLPLYHLVDFTYLHVYEIYAKPKTKQNKKTANI